MLRRSSKVAIPLGQNDPNTVPRIRTGSEPVAALIYLLLFGLGTIVGMILITLILSAPFAFTAVSLPKFNWRLRVASGLVSCFFGMVLIYGIGFADGGLFTASPIWEPVDLVCGLGQRQL
jgi:hypothetical protein